MVMSMTYYPKKVVATKIVAADGTGDFTDIQEAIDALPAGGGVVYIKEGTYIISSAIDITIANVAILGAGASTVIETTGGFTPVDDKMIRSQADNFTLQDVKLDVSASVDVIPLGLLNNNCLVSNLRTVGSTTVNIELDGASQNIITSCILNGGSIGIFAKATSDRNTISDNYIENVDRAVSLWESDENVVVGNNIKGGTQGDSPGIYLRGDSNNNVIVSNRIQEHTYGIEVENAQADENTIGFNNLIGNTSEALLDNGTATDHEHNTPYLREKTSYWSVSGADFVTDNPDVDNTHVTGGLGRETTSGSYEYYKSVNLPHGAVVTAAEVYGTYGAEWTLYRCPIDGNSKTSMASATVTYEDDSISNATIDNENYRYVLKVKYVEDGYAVYGARITYTTDYD